MANKVLVLGGTGYLGSALIGQMNLENIPHHCTTTHAIKEIENTKIVRDKIYLNFLDDLGVKEAIKILEREDYSCILNLISSPKNSNLTPSQLRKISIDSFCLAEDLAKKNKCSLLNFTTVHSKKTGSKNHYERNHRLRNKLVNKEESLGFEFFNIVVPNVFGLLGPEINRGNEYLLNSWINSANAGEKIIVYSLENQTREFMWIKDFTSEVIDIIVRRNKILKDTYLVRNTLKLKFSEVLCALKMAFKECKKKDIEIHGDGYSNWFDDIDSNSLNVRIVKQIISREIVLCGEHKCAF
jgi:nucleoside-diphosphate-sugar epimerase